MMTMFKRFLAAAAVLTLAACGGGGGSSGTPPFGGGGGGGGGGTTPSSVTDLTITLSAPTIPNNGTQTVVATITALDANRNAVPNAAVQVSANSNAVVTIAGNNGSVTDASGTITANIGIGQDQTNRTITITAAANGVTRTANLQVVNSPTGNTPTAIELIAASPSVGTGASGVVITAFVKDANNNALAATPVSFSTNTGTLTGASSSTNASGVATATLSAGADKSNRTATVTVTSGAITQTLTLPITGSKLTLSGPSSLILGNTAAFDIVVTDSLNNVVPGVTVTGTSSLGNTLTPVGSNVSNASGQVRFNYTANNPGTDNLVFSGAGTTVTPTPALVVSGQDFAFVSPTAGSTVPVNTAQQLQVRLRSGGAPQAGQTINFAATGGTLSSATAVTDGSGIASVTLTSSSAGPVTVQATVAGSATTTTLPLTIVATQPTTLVLQVSPTAIAPNIGGSTANQATVVARVTDAAGNPVQGQTVNFARVTDPSGGNLLQASAVTDGSGTASVAYRSGGQSTANNGVVLSATVAGTNVTGTATLTVNQTALFIALGTGNEIQNLDPQTYRKDWVVYVTDSNGIPVNGVTLTIKAIPTRYLTGRLSWNGTVWTYSTPIWSCRNEDANTNGVLDPGEDDNGDGVLWPGNVIAVSPGTVQTVNGRATISLTYAESYVPWVQLKLTASATVSGTESKTDTEFIVSGSGPDFSNETVPPAGVVSPFGLLPRTGASCTQVQ
jgi:hypothetical protein